MCIHVSAIVEKLYYGQPIRHNGFEDFKRKKWYVQNLHMPTTVAKWQEMMIERWPFARTEEVRSPYRGSLTLVQGKSVPRTGERQSRWREGLNSSMGSDPMEATVAERSAAAGNENYCGNSLW